MPVRRLVALVIGLAAVVAVAAPATAATDTSAESEFVALVNGARADRGLAALTVATDLRSVARRHAVRMADEGRVFHNPGLAGEVEGWQRLGENVGRGPTVEDIHAAFMASDSHRRNILDEGFTQVGIGVEARDGVLWVTEIFREPMAGSSGPEPTPSETPPPAPRDPPSSEPPAPGPVPSEDPSEEPAPAAPEPSEGGLPAPLSSFAPAGGPAVPSDPPVDLPGPRGEHEGGPVRDAGGQVRAAPLRPGPPRVVASAITVSIRPCLRSVIPAGCVVAPTRQSMLEVASILARLEPRPTRF